MEVSTGAPRQDALPGQQGNPRDPDLPSGDQGREDGQSGPPGGGVGGDERVRGGDGKRWGRAQPALRMLSFLCLSFVCV